MLRRLGLPSVPETSSAVHGDLIDWRDARYYRITAYDLMDPFFVSVVSDNDLWMYVSTTGGLAAGRRDSSHSLFPYETVDKLHHGATHSGPTTVIRCPGDDGDYLWEPFSSDGRLRYDIERAIYKHELGNGLWYEEVNRSLGLTFRYGWRPSARFGWVRTAEVESARDSEIEVTVLDGVQNILPAGVSQGLQDSASCLVDAYKSSEYDAESGLALYRLSANIVDRAIASEALRTTVAWHAGLDGATVHLNSSCRDDVLHGRVPASPSEFNGRRGAFLVHTAVVLASQTPSTWHIALDTPLDHIAVADLKARDRSPATIEGDIHDGCDQLRALLAGADAFQATGDPLAATHHVANVLFNIARGGVPPNNYHVERRDLVTFLETRNRAVSERARDWLASLPEVASHKDLLERAEARADANLLRLVYEYLPLVFSRRHGDPSRPWNRFEILMTNPDGTTSYAYQGNWRDIFQNWEALARSYPELIEPMIAKFVNASTVDGFNPYRITREGIDWEISDPDDPWSSIGYWGDHQIVYLLKLLEASLAHQPLLLSSMLDRDLFSYADVPYDIRPYSDIVHNPQDTIEFNHERQRRTEERVERVGTDGRLVHRGDELVHVNLAEKLLVPILAKVSNLVPGAGIWMNTMRPEWNDANNALVGNGVSMVTACYLYRHLGVCADILERGPKTTTLSAPVVEWLEAVDEAVTRHAGATGDDRERRAFMDDAGTAFSNYRRVYTNGMGAREAVATERVVEALRNVRSLLAETIRSNRRDDDLYHAYNVLHLGDGSATIERLPLMLEGQVAILSGGLLEPDEAVALLRALRASDLYREDQHSYLLYPEKELPDFGAKNRVPDSLLDDAPSLRQLLDDGDRSIVARDATGQLRFHADLHNADALRPRLAHLPENEADAVLAAYESVFDHKAFTGRSGTMYGYEGIGCIYWHMVAKLLLAVQENFYTARANGTDGAAIDRLREYYFDIRAGLGFMKTPEEFGAFPLDPYSHTPAFAGARQPGMTGQVKEEILSRWGELGVTVAGGTIVFDPLLLHDGEYVTGRSTFSFIDVGGTLQALELSPASLAFTLCQVPIVYTRGDAAAIHVRYADGTAEEVAGSALSGDATAALFARTGAIERIDVTVPS